MSHLMEVEAFLVGYEVFQHELQHELAVVGYLLRMNYRNSILD
jgi:hypothetical protein